MAAEASTVISVEYVNPTVNPPPLAKHTFLIIFAHLVGLPTLMHMACIRLVLKFECIILF